MASVFVDALGLNEKCGQFEECIAECSDIAFSYEGMKNLMLNFHSSNFNRRSALALSCVRPCNVMRSPAQCHVFARAMSRVRPCPVVRSPLHCHVFALQCHVLAHALSCVLPRTVTCSPCNVMCSSVHRHVFALQCNVFTRAPSRVRLAM
jgi:hypothetical protein